MRNMRYSIADSTQRPPPRLPSLPPPDWPPAMKEMHRAGLSHQVSLEDTIATALKQVESGEYDTTALKTVLQSAQHHVNELGGFFSERLKKHPELYNERKPEGSSIAAQVFDIPELLEMILGHLPVSDLLKFYQCSRSIRDSIEASSKLQNQLSLRPAPAGSHLKLPLSDLAYVGFTSIEQFQRRQVPQRLEKKDEVKDRTVEIHAHFNVLPGQVLPRIGSRVRGMFITQPPLEEMTVNVECCPIYVEWQTSESVESCKSVRTVTRVGGLTLGALYDRAEELLDAHRFCPSAHSGLLNEDGTVNVAVKFVGKMVLRLDDPVYVKGQEEKKRMEEEDQKWQRQDLKMSAFCNARRTAHLNGDSIPSLKEFVACHGEDADWAALAHPPYSDPLQSNTYFNGIPNQTLLPPPPPPPLAANWFPMFPSNNNVLDLSGASIAPAEPASRDNTSTDIMAIDNPMPESSSVDSGSLVVLADPAAAVGRSWVGASAST